MDINESAGEVSIGVAQVDAQHAGLVAGLGELLAAATRGGPGKSLAPLLDTLQAQVVEHFRTEEDLMARTGFAAQAQHKARHDAFVQSFLSLRSDLEAGECGEVAAKRIEREVGAWLVGHIRGFDMAMGQYLNTHGIH